MSSVNWSLVGSFGMENNRAAGQSGDGRNQGSAHFACEFAVFDISHLQEVVVAHAAGLVIRPAQHGGVAQDQRALRDELVVGFLQHSC